MLFNLMPASMFDYPTGTGTADLGSDAASLMETLGNFSSLLWAFALPRDANTSYGLDGVFISSLQLNNVTLVLPPVELQVRKYKN